MPFRGNAEIVKFGIYLLFPVSALFLFNTPGVLSFFPSPGMDKVRDAIQEEKRNLYAIPKSLNSISDTLDKIKNKNNPQP